MKKVLFVATVLRKHIDQFHIPYIKYFQEKGYVVDVVAQNDHFEKSKAYKNGYNFIEVEFSRQPFSRKNLTAYRKMKSILHEGDYEIVHCHTPIAAFLTRMASRKLYKKNKIRVIYTAHGFQFDKSGSLFNWFFLIPEIIAGYYTHDLITINQEDFAVADRFIPARKIYKVRGVGVSLDAFKPLAQYHHNQNQEFKICYVAEFIPRKNHDLLLRSMTKLKNKGVRFKLYLFGDGILEEEIKDKVMRWGLEEEVVFMGYRNDINKILPNMDLSVSTSLREGLPINILESFASGVPVVATNSRGNRDLLYEVDSKLVVPFDPSDISQTIYELLIDEGYYKFVRKKSIEVSKKYELGEVLSEYRKIYKI